MPGDKVSIYSTWQLRSWVSKQGQLFHNFPFSQSASAKHFLSVWNQHLQNWVKIQTPMQTFRKNPNTNANISGWTFLFLLQNISRSNTLTSVIRQNPPCLKRRSNVVSLTAQTWTPPFFHLLLCFGGSWVRSIMRWLRFLQDLYILAHFASGCLFYVTALPHCLVTDLANKSCFCFSPSPLPC